MKESRGSKRTSPLIWSSLILSAGCVGYVLTSQWLFLVVGIVGFTLTFIFRR